MPLSLSEEAQRAIAQVIAPSGRALAPLAGHIWTVAPWLRSKIAPVAAPASSPFLTTVFDARLGAVPVRGWIRHVPGARTILVLVHGLGGSPDSHYIAPAAVAADRAGMSCLRLELRGSGGSGDDIYHAGLTEDLRVALETRDVARYERAAIVGYSLGGHVALRYATEGAGPRVAAVAAICAPIDLDRTARAIDRPESWVYRRHVLEGLKAHLTAVARRGRLPFPLERALAIERLRDWDALVVAPRFGFQSVEHYYATASVGPHLGQLAVPALLVASETDPMVPATTVRPALAASTPKLDVRWTDRGGHVGFPAGLDLGIAGPRGLEGQVLSWLATHLR